MATNNRRLKKKFEQHMAASADLLERVGKIAFIGVTGPTNAGQSTLCRKTHGLMQPKTGKSAILWFDASDVVRYGLDLADALGELVSKQKERMKSGFYLTDDVMCPLFLRWLEKITKENPNLRILIMAGFPRTELQMKMLDIFRAFHVTSVVADYEVLKAAFLKRAENSSREDDAKGLPFFNTRMKQYHKHTVPMLKKFRSSILTIERNNSLIQKLSLILHRLWNADYPLLSNNERHSFVKTALSRLKDAEHPIRKLIAKMESPMTIRA